MIRVDTFLFKPGRVVATPGAVEALGRAGQGAWAFVARHLCGDWGEVDAGDRRANDDALRDGSRILSAYTTAAGDRLWVITEAEDGRGHRAATTILRPDEY